MAIDVSAQGGADKRAKVNVETLSANKILIASDVRHQKLNINGTARDVTLPAHKDGLDFIIENTDVYTSNDLITLKADGGATLTTLPAQAVWAGVSDGTNWHPTQMGSAGTILRRNVTTGDGANAYNRGVATGDFSQARNEGTATGEGTHAEDGGVAAGRGAYAFGGGLSTGYLADGNLKDAIALGPQSEASRHGELTIAVDVNATNARWSRQFWSGSIAAAAEPAFTEIFLKGTASNRATIIASTAIAFTGQVVAISNHSGTIKTAKYTFSGLITRDASNNTTLKVGPNVATVYEDEAGWDLQVTADDTNESLKIEFKGNDSDTANFAVLVTATAEFTEVLL